MSVSFAKAVAAGLQAYGVPVRFWTGWETRGNGQVSAYRGMIWHHTASNYGKAYNALVTGRSDLSGPLCNSSGDDDGGITIVSANPANHAGASGGRSMGPLPVTNTFNKYVWGHEIVYPGTKPMTDAQRKSATILAAVIAKVLKAPNAEIARGHAETSITGKFDPGYANGKTVDLVAMRRDSTILMNTPSVGDDELSAKAEQQIQEIHDKLMQSLNSDTHHMNKPDDAVGNILAIRHLLEEVHWELRGALNAEIGRPGGDVDTQWGHNMSSYARIKEMEARLNSISDKIDAVVAKVNGK
jgi:hypothetical protein